ncbi:MAG: hypothetical protein AB1461_04060 [Thermodesulfobacteriota bacterium]
MAGYRFAGRKYAITAASRSPFTVSKIVDSKDFVRINAIDNDTLLQIDFVNGRVKRFGDFTYQGAYRLDNPLNILSNKISAVQADACLSGYSLNCLGNSPSIP